ncbi:MAG: hypothetical protein ACRDAX_00220, partial [Propionibacteriaceae bacterium]
MSTHSIDPSTQMEKQTPVKDAKPKPIYVDAKFNRVLDLLKYHVMIPIRPFPLLKIIRNDESNPLTRIDCSCLSTKTKTMDELKRSFFSFHTHSEPGSRVKMFVLKNFYKVSCEVMKKNLMDLELPVSKVSMLVDHPSRPIFLIHSDDVDLNIQTLQHKYRAISQIIVSWEKYDYRRKRPMPCRNCKMWGHSAINCNRKYRCIKCDQKHDPGKCLRTDRTVGTPKCVNCLGDHPANSQQCPEYIKYRERQQKRQHRLKEIVQTDFPLRFDRPQQRQQENFQNYAGVLKTSNDIENSEGSPQL